jgi:hypothetical protein
MFRQLGLCSAYGQERPLDKETLAEQDAENAEATN